MRVWIVLLAWFCLVGGARAQQDLRERGVALSLKVADFSAATRTLNALATRLGGESSDGVTQVSEKGRRYGWIRLRVPRAKLEEGLVGIRAVGTLYGERRLSRDWSAAHTELEKRADALHTHAGRLDGLLVGGRRMRAGDILFLQERLFRAGIDEQLLRQRRTNLEGNVQTVSFNVTLFEPLPIRLRDRVAVDLSHRFSQGMTSAREGLMQNFGRAATGAGYLLTFAPLWLPALIAFVWLLRRSLPVAIPLVLRAVQLAGQALAPPIARLRAEWAVARAPHPMPPLPPQVAIEEEAEENP